MERVRSSHDKALQEDSNLPADIGLLRALKVKVEGSLQQRETIRGHFLTLGPLPPDAATGQAKSPRGSMTQPAHQGL